MSGVEARAIVEAAVRLELFGPTGAEPPRGTPLDCSQGSISFPTAEASRGTFHEAGTLQEILTQTDPLRRYGIGVLYGGGNRGGSVITTPENTTELANAESDVTWVIGLSTSEDSPDGPLVEIDQRAERGQPSRRYDEADSDDFDLTDANSFKPSAMALSFKCRVPKDGALDITVRGAYYERIRVQIGGLKNNRAWWVRRPFELTGSIPGQVLLQQMGRLKDVTTSAESGLPRVAPTTQILSRPVHGEPDLDLRLVTVAVVNHSQGTGPSSALFQMGFTVTPRAGLAIEPYPAANRGDLDEEEQSIELLYRNKQTFAIGHGCAAEWDTAGGTAASWVRSEPLPAYEVTSLTPDVFVTDVAGKRKRLTVSMAALAAGTSDGQHQVETVLEHYGEWIAGQESAIPGLLPRFQAAARRHLDLCGRALERIQAGWELAKSDPIASQAFRWANEAMLYQQVRSRLPLREVVRESDGTLKAFGPHPEAEPQPDQGNWRPFQIAFILASLTELVNPTAATRALVDLIFFPTGGGKTEAYLGASAISLLARRIRDPNDAGTDTIMRYTLRLLTAQQFLRAASLICVLEDIRSKNPAELGTERFGIGVWLGGDSTPNNWKNAVDSLKSLGKSTTEPNRFLLLRCPWCGTQMGPKPRPRGGQDAIGYEQSGKRVFFRCIDGECRYGRRDRLPVHIVDQDIYDVRPSIVIGTVDKFAMLAWRPEASRLFGLADDGSREVSPPGLIIQDELHLISGPLGSMVGLYEVVIDDLCTDRRGDVPVPPKIIASTATIRQYEDQIRGVFGRERVALFPPHGLEEGHSFFAEAEKNPDGTNAPGRRYLGILSSSLGSTQTVQVRVTAATLQAGTEIPESDRDGYWTNLNFLNSLRELGNTVSLLQSDVPDYLTGLRNRDGIDPRWPRNTMELTSRRRNDEIPRAIEELQARYGGSQQCVDICLASNIIEVGVDIDRLGLMTIVGQPKTTAQYIQVSGRVGRRPSVSPGLVITIYGAARPRDRSHYERFRTYHQSLYAQVEPTSVTPFAVPVLRRALHAVTVARIRQTASWLEPFPFPQAEYDEAIALLLHRAKIVDEEESRELKRMARQRAREWDAWERTEWSANPQGGDPVQGLMRYAGTLPSLDSKATVWDVPTSMRNVDAECRLKVSTAYSLEDAEEEAGDEL
jgi:Helicase conserved C-terminal domain